MIEAMAAERPAGPRVRGHPLGRPRHARPDRAPGAVGARPAAAALPGARRAARAPRELGRRPPRGHVDLPRAAHADRDARPGRLAAARPTRRRPELVPAVAERAGGNPFFAEEMVRRLVEEGAADATALPDTVQALLAARLDSLDRFERRLVQHAAVVGRTFWEDALAPVADAEGRDLERALTALQEKDIVVPGEGTALAGEREFAFKHVLIRDVAYGMLPKAVRARKHFEVGELHRGARRRPHRRGRRAAGRALRRAPRRWATRRASRPPSSQPIQRQGAALPRGRGRRRRRLLLEPRGLRALRVGARSGPPTPATARASARSRATSRCGWAGSTRRSRCGRSASSTTACRRTSSASPTCTARSAPASGTRASASRRSSTTRRASTCSRTARPASSSCASTRRPPRSTCTRATTCSRSTRPRRRCGWPSGWGRRARPARARHLRPRLRAHRRHREGAREPGALGRAGARLRRRRDDPRAARARPSPRDLRGRLRRRRGRLPRGRSTWPSEVGDLPAQVELHAALAQLAVYRADWEGVRRSPRRAPSSPSARAWSASSASRTALRGAAALARRRVGRGRAPVPPRARAGRAGRLVRGGLRGAVRARGARCATAATPPARSPRSPRRSTCASAPA